MILLICGVEALEKTEVDTRRNDWIRGLLKAHMAGEKLDLTPVRDLDQIRDLSVPLLFVDPSRRESVRLYDSPVVRRENGCVEITGADRYFIANQSDTPPDVWDLAFNSTHAVTITGVHLEEGYVHLINTKYPGA